MKKDLAKTNLKSSFLSCGNDIRLILRKLLVENQPYSDELKRLLIVNTKDCLTNLDNEIYKKKIKGMGISKLISEGYIKLNPKIKMPEHEEIKSYIIISFDNFTPTDNPQYRDCTIHFDIISHTDYWDLNDFEIRPLKIAGYIDGLLNNQKMSGIGTLAFAGCNELVLNEHLSGYTLSFRATHGVDDKIVKRNNE